jgi:hypothetical protein
LVPQTRAVAVVSLVTLIVTLDYGPVVLSATRTSVTAESCDTISGSNKNKEVDLEIALALIPVLNRSLSRSKTTRLGT